ncbi:MAG TPA: glycerol-3-phosphate dehydrogenase/oxidase [Pirellulales bacterium]|nr:glycerol-3-phosphate dehydrogenase/oxidase [Pirellulales bacterium]
MTAEFNDLRAADRSCPSPVLILGAGINGAALARELVLGGLPVVVVDTGDLARGATAYSSRLIHGGLRYLEYGEFDLVRESLAERTRLLRLAPHLVRPLKLFIPVRNRWGGVLESARRFFKRPPKPGAKPAERGLWLVRAGLTLYDWYARDPALPRHHVLSPQNPTAPPVDARRYRSLCAYYDAQVRYPERFVVALLDDADRLAAEQKIEFRVLTYHRAALDGSRITIHPIAGDEAAPPVAPFQPAAIVNATGAWVDLTLAELHVPAARLMGGTKGSHLVTSHAGLRAAVSEGGIYSEAADGRPVFILPFGRSTLVGTTDLPYSGDPADAVATEREIDYLVSAVNLVFPQLGFTHSDIDLHYSGVRPLPHVDETTPAAITRRHWLAEHPGGAVPLFSVVGGKLTTCRSLAETAAATLRTRLGMRAAPRTSRDRFLPGGEGYPADDASTERFVRDLAERTGFARDQVRAVWELRGTQTGDILAYADRERTSVPGTDIPRGVVRWVIEREWVRRLDDLVERRLMLLYDPRLSETTLRALAELLVESELLSTDQIDSAVRETVERLRRHFAKKV